MTISDLFWIAAGLFSAYWSIGQIDYGYRILRDQTYSYRTKSIFRERKTFQRNGKYTRPYGIACVVCGIIALTILSLLLINGIHDVLSLVIYPPVAGTFFEAPGLSLSEWRFRDR